MDQPGYGRYVITATGKWTYDARLISTTNAVFELFGLLTVPMVDNTRAQIIVTLFSQCFGTSCNDHDKFK